MQGLSASNNDILDLIQEIQFLRETYDLPAPELPPKQPVTITSEHVVAEPWTEWPGNP